MTQAHHHRSGAGPGSTNMSLGASASLVALLRTMAGCEEQGPWHGTLPGGQGCRWSGQTWLLLG